MRFFLEYFLNQLFKKTSEFKFLISTLQSIIMTHGFMAFEKKLEQFKAFMHNTFQKTLSNF